MLNERQLRDKLISSALIQIIEERPFYYSMLKRIPKFFRNDITRPCALGIDQLTGRFSILFNARTFPTAQVNQVKIMLEHLLMHILFPQHHQDRIEHGHSFHLACDLLINDNISDIKNNRNVSSKKNNLFGKLLLSHVLDEIPGYNSSSLDNSSAHEVWPIINNEKYVKGLDSFDTIDETDFSIQNFMSVSRWKKINPENSKLLQTQVNRAVVDAVTELAKLGKGPGLLPDFLAMRINDILYESQVDYSTLLKKFTTRIIGHVHQRTWTRVHRKYPNQIRGRGKKISHNPRLLIIMDTSQSMWQEALLNKVMAETKKLKEIIPDLWIVGGDVIEQFRVCLKDDEFSPKRFALFGGGGTDLQFGFEAAKNLEVDGAIVLTDGFIPDFNTHGITTAFVIVPGGIAVPGFENIFLT